MSYKIFVQIASYRDPELISTVLDLFEKSNNPESLRVAVCWQHDDFECLDSIKHLIEYIDIPYTDSLGVCFARNLLQNKYDGETYTLQLDSHHRFIKNWDVELISMYTQCIGMGSEFPIITSYLPAYNVIDNIQADSPCKMEIKQFLDDGPLLLTPKPLRDFKQLKSPVSARFFSGHFAFTEGQFCNKVKYDPEYYFYGEETNIAVRAYTHGYDLYHPHKIVGWHQYIRDNRIKHWDDHVYNNNKSWSELDIISKKRYRKLFGIENNDAFIDKVYGFGTIRTLKEYELYSGIDFKTNTISDTYFFRTS